MTIQLTKEIKELATFLLANGYTIIVSTKNDTEKTYCHSARGGNIGYAQYDRVGGFSLSTVNKPCKECGTGFRVHTGNMPIIEQIDSCFNIAPTWAQWKDAQAVIKYEGVADFISHRSNTWADYKEITSLD